MPEETETLIQDTTEAAPERPEWLPEKFNDPSELAKSYSELESKLGAKQEDIIKGYNEERFVNRPEAKGDYELPDIVDSELASDNPLLNWWSEHAFNNGFSQDQFKEGIEMYSKGIQESLPPPPNLEEEAAKLGDNSGLRIEAVSMFANKFFPDNLSGAVEKLGETAEGIMLIEHIMSQNKDTQITAQSSPVSSFGEDDLKSMMRDERYWDNNKRDASFVKQVDDGFKKLYG
jgi:hypothetical protein